MLMEYKIHDALQTIAIKYYTKAEVYKKDLERFIHLRNENSSHSCYLDDSLCELVRGDDW